MNLKDIMTKIDDVNTANGWREKPVSIPEDVALLRSEPSELCPFCDEAAQ
jgi:hypothetical protein